jgi:uncharacterized protein YejL (UPF0352 family)
VYYRDLEEDYIDKEVEDLIQYMCQLFTKHLEDDDISLIVQGSKLTIANQQLPKAFRIAFVKVVNDCSDREVGVLSSLKIEHIFVLQYKRYVQGDVHSWRNT